MENEAKKATLYAMVGLPCSGKTVRAKGLEEKGVIRFSPDEWEDILIGDDWHNALHDDVHSGLEFIMTKLASKLLKKGVDIVLDFGLWSKEEREAVAGIAARSNAELVICPCEPSFDELVSRAEQRSDEDGPVISAAELAGWYLLYDDVTDQEIEELSKICSVRTEVLPYNEP